MQTIADALVYAVAFINRRDTDKNDDLLEADADALGSIAGLLEGITPAEEDALAAAAERALAGEKQLGGGRPEFVRDYANWMEEMFGEGWEGNCRVST